MIIDLSLISNSQLLILFFRRDEIIECIKLRFVEKNKANLPIFGIPSQNLRAYTTTEKDMKKGYSRFPPNELRIKEEDLIRERTVT